MELLIDYFVAKYELPLEEARLAYALISLFITTVLVLALPVIALIFYRSKRQYDHITYSVNELETQADGTTLLAIRTVEMLPKEDILTSNWYFAWKLRFARSRCKSDQPFIIMNKHDMDLYQPSLVSCFSKLFIDGILAELAGLPVKKCNFLLAATHEVYDNGTPYKDHVMVVRECDLDKFADSEFCKTLRFERSHHVDRVNTLQRMYERRRWELAHTEVDDVRTIRTVQGAFRI